MAEADQVRALLTLVADPPGGPVVPPGPELAARGRARRRRRQVVAVSVVAGLTAVAVAVPVALFGARATHRGTVATASAVPVGPAVDTASVRDLAAGRWTRMPAAPVPPRILAAVAWTGDRMIVWGGMTGSGASRADGAAYDPVRRRWEVLPTAPLAARNQAASAWTGSALFIWGGDSGDDGSRAFADGALYDPRARTWRRLPPGPLAARMDAQAVWTGREVVVIGGLPSQSSSFGPLSTDVAAYDPATNRWRSLPPLPLRPGYIAKTVAPVVVNGAVYLVLATEHDEPFGTGTRIWIKGETWRYDPGGTAWARVDTGETASGITHVLWTGREILIPAANPYLGLPEPDTLNLHGWRLAPPASRWRAMAKGALDNSAAESLWTGAALVSWAAETRVVAWDPGADRWTSLPPAPVSLSNDAVAVWTGTHLLLWLPSGEGLSFGRP